MRKRAQHGLSPVTVSKLMGTAEFKIKENSTSHSCAPVPVSPGVVYRVPSAISTSYPNLSELGIVYLQAYDVTCASRPGSGRTHRAVVCWVGENTPGLDQDEMEPPHPSPTSSAWVSCSCGYFRYTCEWALSRFGSSDIIHSNGEPAKIRNPFGIPYICKHLYIAIPQALSDSAGAYNVEDTKPREEDTGTVPSAVPDEVAVTPEVAADDVDIQTLPDLTQYAVPLDDEETRTPAVPPPLPTAPSLSPLPPLLPDEYDFEKDDDEDDEAPLGMPATPRRNASYLGSDVHKIRYTKTAERLRSLVFRLDECDDC